MTLKSGILVQFALGIWLVQVATPCVQAEQKSLISKQSSSAVAASPAKISPVSSRFESSPVVVSPNIFAPLHDDELDMQREARVGGKSRPQITKEYRAPELVPEREGFFSRNSASTTFSPPLALGQKPKLEYFPATQTITEDEEEGAAKMASLDPESDSDSLQKKDSKPDYSTADGIIAAVGAPDQDDIILADEKAPPSFRGMMAALQIKDEKLAWKYARRYVRRVREFANRSATIMGLTGKAFEREGVLPKGGWQSSPQFAAQQKLLDEDLKETAEFEREQSRIASLDPATREFLRKAQEVEEMEGPSAAKVNPAPLDAFDEKRARTEVRQRFAGRVPVDPNGLVDVYFFFRPGDSNSRAMAADIESLYRSMSTQGGLRFVALTMEQQNTVELDSFRRATGATFPVRSGGALAQQFKLKEAPVTVFVTETTNKVVTESGVRPYYYLDELLKLMRGK